MKYQCGDRVYWIDLCAIQSAKILNREPSVPGYRAIRDGEASACYLTNLEQLHPSPEQVALALVKNYYSDPGRNILEDSWQRACTDSLANLELSLVGILKEISSMKDNDFKLQDRIDNLEEKLKSLKPKRVT